MDAYCIGWDLEHPEVEPCALDDVQSWNAARVIFLAYSAIEGLWRRAAGRPLSVFRSPRLEHECWRELHDLIGRMRAYLDRGGLLFCRLDLPESRCRVADPPGLPDFPPGSQLNAYEALATVDSTFAAIAATCGRLLQSRLVRHTTGHALDGYLEAYERTFRPDVALRELPAGCEPLASTGDGLALAVASDSVVWLPPLRVPDPIGEGQLLHAAAMRMLGRDALDPRRPVSINADDASLSAREQQLACKIAQLEAQRAALRGEREARAWLVQQLDHPRAAEDELLRRARVLLHLDDSAALPGRPCKNAPSIATRQRAVSSVLPVDLRRALAAALIHPQCDRALYRLERSLRSLPDGWRFCPQEVLLEPEEIAEFGVTQLRGHGN
ncbi:MAG: hypothetical protein K1X74_17680 [Pirellulales bacterium]|nr:hypothetical protein [Pirellulales bacterium]